MLNCIVKKYELKITGEFALSVFAFPRDRVRFGMYVYLFTPRNRGLRQRARIAKGRDETINKLHTRAPWLPAEKGKNVTISLGRCALAGISCGIVGRWNYIVYTL